MIKVFIDGSAGTTGLRIRERLSARKDIELIILPEETRKDPAARADALNSAAVSFLCLPDAAAIEAASFVTSPDAVIIDTSTAHRVSEDWVYGMPELTGLREKLKTAKRIANPGCHATGFISLVAPLVSAGLLKKDVRLSSFSLTGYSGGGKKMIAEYEAENVDPLYQAPRQYGLTQMHKHLPEMAKLCSLDHAPVFSPIVAPYYAGMEVTVPRAFAGRDDLQVSVYGNEERILLVSRFDNLGKGASGAAIQNMNIALGLDEAEGLVV